MSIPLFEQANKLNEEGKYPEAMALYDQLLTQNHDNPDLLGTVSTVILRDSRNTGLAMTLLHYTIKQFKKRGKPVPSGIYTNLAVAYKQSGQYDKCKHYLETSIAIEPSVGALTNYGSMFVEQNDPEKGEKALRQAISIEPDNYLPHWNLSLILLESGRWKEGWEKYEYGENPTGMRLERKVGDRPKWDGTPGKTVCVTGEQGIGDEIMFASMLPDMMKENTVIFECHKRLQTLFEHSFPGLKCYGTRKEAEIFWPEAEQFDYRIAIGTLGKYYRNSIESFSGTPYLKADPLLPKGRKFRVGISWTGGRLTQRVAKRTVPLNWWRSILTNDCEFVSLQYTDDSEIEVESVEKLGYKIAQYPEAKDHDYYKTAQLVASCDLVITVCTSIVHLAGALGVPCWVMTPKYPAWRYQREGKMPWYRSVRLYRQAEDSQDAWIPVVQRIGFDLEEHLAAQKQRKVA